MKDRKKLLKGKIEVEQKQTGFVGRQHLCSSGHGMTEEIYQHTYSSRLIKAGLLCFSIEMKYTFFLKTLLIRVSDMQNFDSHTLFVS